MVYMSDLCLHCTCLIIKFFINNLKQKVCCLYLFFLLRSKHHFKYFCFILYELYNYGTISVTNARRFFLQMIALNVHFALESMNTLKW